MLNTHEPIYFFLYYLINLNGRAAFLWLCGFLFKCVDSNGTSLRIFLVKESYEYLQSPLQCEMIAGTQ